MKRNLSLIQLPVFSANWKRLRLSDEDLRALEAAIMVDPEGPPVIRGTGGLRKIRFAAAASSAGKSGGLRACYAYFPEFGLIYLCAVFQKNDKANLTDAEAAAYKQILQRFAKYLRANFRQRGVTP
jgi:hypothetical protein